MTIKLVTNPNILVVKPLTVDKVINKYTISNQAEGKSASTIKWYAEMLNAFALYAKSNLHDDNFKVFNLEVIRDYIIYLQKRPRFYSHPCILKQQKMTISARTIQCHVRVLKAFSSWLHAQKYTNENKFKNLKLPKAPVRVMEPLSPEEINKICASIKKDTPAGQRNYAMLVTLLDTGLRASEIAYIKLGHVNFEHSYLKNKFHTSQPISGPYCYS